MRKLLPLFLIALTAPAFAQDKTPAAAPSNGEFLAGKYWSELGKPVEGQRGFTVYTRNMQPKADSLFEMWVKIVPANAAAFNRRYGLPKESAFVVQFARVDCTKRLISFEKTAAYDAANNSIDPRGSELVKGETRTRVKSGSVGETVFEYICVKLPS